MFGLVETMSAPPLRMPNGFFPKRISRGKYVRAATDEAKCETPVSHQRSWPRWLGDCWYFLWNGKEIRRRQKVAAAIEECQRSKKAFEQQVATLSAEVDSYTIAIQHLVKSKETEKALSKLRLKKQKLLSVKKFRSHIDEMDRKLLALNELLSDQDVVRAVQSVAVAMAELDVSKDLDVLDDSSNTIVECQDDIRELSDAVNEMQQFSLTDDEEALVKELELLMGDGDSPPPSVGKMEIVLPTVPTEALIAKPTLEPAAIPQAS